jgi:hypothetical protein
MDSLRPPERCNLLSRNGNKSCDLCGQALNHLTDALHDLERAAELAPGDSEILKCLETVRRELQEQGKAKEVRRMLEEAGPADDRGEDPTLSRLQVVEEAVKKLRGTYFHNV